VSTLPVLRCPWHPISTLESEQTVPNLVMVKVGASDGNVMIYNNNGQVHVIFDVVGYFAP